MKGLDLLQQALDAHQEPDDWPDDVCRDAWCGRWERCNGYVPHTAADHIDADESDLDARNVDLARDRMGMFPIDVVEHLAAVET